MSKKHNPLKERPIGDYPSSKEKGDGAIAWTAKLAADNVVSFGNQWLFDYGDELVATMVATYFASVETPPGGSYVETFKEVYKEAQKDAENVVEDARERSPVSTMIMDIVSPTVLSKLKIAGKLGEGTVDILKGIGKGGQQVLRTALESFATATGRSKGGQDFDDHLLNGAIGTAVSIATHGLLKGLGFAAEKLGLGKRAKVAADTLGAYLTTSKKFVGKAKNKGRTSWEASTRLWDKMFKNNLVTHTNVDYDPKLRTFVPKKGYRIKAPNVSDIERNIVNALNTGAKAADNILEEAGKGEVGTKGVTFLDIQDIIEKIKADAEEKYTGEDLKDVNRALRELQIKGHDLVKRTGKSSVKLLNELRIELDNKIKKSFGSRGEDETSIMRDINKVIVGELRGVVKNKIKDPVKKDEFLKIMDDMEDFYEVRKGVRLKGEMQAKGSNEKDIYYTDPGMLRSATQFTRENLGVPYHVSKETPSGSSDFFLPSLNTKKIKHTKYHGEEWDPSRLANDVAPPTDYTPSILPPSREALADMPSRIANTVGNVASENGYEDGPGISDSAIQDTDPGYYEPGRYPKEQSYGQQIGTDVMDQIGQEREMRQQKMQENNQKKMLDTLRMAKLPRNSEEFIANKELVLAKFAQDAPIELNNISHILSFEPDKIEDAMILYSQQNANLFTNDRYKRINGKIVDNIAKNQARKETMDREDISTIEKATIIDNLNKTGSYTADIDLANKKEMELGPKPGMGMSDVISKLKTQPVVGPELPKIDEGKELTPDTGYMKQTLPSGEVKSAEMPALDNFF